MKTPSLMEIIHFCWTKDTKERPYFRPPPCPAHKRTEIYFFLIQNWLVACGLTEVFYCQHSKQMQEAADSEKARRLCLKPPSSSTQGQAPEKRSRMGQFTQTWTGPPCRAGLTPSLPPRLSEGSRLGNPKLPGQFPVPSLFLYAFW